jgi:hypothetical protein
VRENHVGKRRPVVSRARKIFSARQYKTIFQAGLVKGLLRVVCLGHGTSQLRASQMFEEIRAMERARKDQPEYQFQRTACRQKRSPEPPPAPRPVGQSRPASPQRPERPKYKRCVSPRESGLRAHFSVQRLQMSISAKEPAK